MLLRYKGTESPVQVGSNGPVVKYGDIKDFPAEIAQSLISSGNFEEARPKARAPVLTDPAPVSNDHKEKTTGKDKKRK